MSARPDFLFDIGKVLLDFDFETSLKKYIPQDHPAPDAVLEKLLVRKDEFEAGRIPTEPYTQWAMETIEFQGDTQDFHRAWCDIFTPNLPMWEIARELKNQGHRLILFSNTNAIHCPWIFEAFPEFDIFEGAVLSFETGFIKPEEPIYQHAIDKYGLIPENTLYIDDLPANIATGNAFGFRTHLYDLNDHAAFEQWLTNQLQTETSKS